MRLLGGHMIDSELTLDLVDLKPDKVMALVLVCQ